MNNMQENLYLKTIASLEQQIRILREEKEKLQTVIDKINKEKELLKIDNLGLLRSYLETKSDLNTVRKQTDCGC